MLRMADTCPNYCKVTREEPDGNNQFKFEEETDAWQRHEH
jgi:hypothetical protein